MPSPGPFSDPTVDVYETDTPYGLVLAIFDTDPDVLGVRFYPDDGPQAWHMKQIINLARGSDGIGLTPESLSQDDYFDFCQPDGVTIEQPWYLREEAADMPTFDEVGGS